MPVTTRPHPAPVRPPRTRPPAGHQDRSYTARHPPASRCAGRSVGRLRDSRRGRWPVQDTGAACSPRPPVTARRERGTPPRTPSANRRRRRGREAPQDHESETWPEGLFRARPIQTVAFFAWRCSDRLSVRMHEVIDDEVRSLFAALVVHAGKRTLSTRQSTILRCATRRVPLDESIREVRLIHRNSCVRRGPPRPAPGAACRRHGVAT